jgi:hypothetical protein
MITLDATPPLFRQAAFLQKPPSSSGPFWDSGASTHLIKDHHLAYDFTPLPRPLSIDGVTGTSNSITHSCKITCLPDTVNGGLFGPHLAANLFSLGKLQRHGGSYDSINRSSTQIHLPSASPHLTFTPITVPLSSNNLLPVDVNYLLRLKRMHPQLFRRAVASPNTASYMATLPTPTTSVFPTMQTFRESPPPQVAPATITINALQRKRAQEANDLHIALDCIPDAALCEIIANGKIDTHLTAADIHLNRRLNPICIHCTEGRAKQPSAPSSTSAPATRPGQHLSYDIQKLHTPARGGFTHMNTITDEHTGFTSLPGMINKTTQSTFNSIKEVILRDYNANSHKVDSIHSDPENVNISIIPKLNAIGVHGHVKTPQHHARQVERTRQTIQNTARSVHSRLNYHLPPDLNLYLEQHVVHNLNRRLNSRSDPQHPLTPEEAVTGKRSIASVPFGTIAMVHVPIDKRTRQAALHNKDPNTQPRAELAVSMGFCPKTGGTRYLLGNGLIVPRIAISLFPHNTTIIPFNFKPKIPDHSIIPDHSNLISPLPPHPDPQIPDQPPAQQPQPNSVLQLPNEPDTRQALALMTDLVPQQNPHILNELRLLQPQLPSTSTNPTPSTPTQRPHLLPPAPLVQESPAPSPLPFSPGTSLIPPSFPPQPLDPLPPQSPQHVPLAPLPPQSPQHVPLQPSAPNSQPRVTAIPIQPASPVILPPPIIMPPQAPSPPLRRSLRGAAKLPGHWSGHLALMTPLPDIPTNHLQRKKLLNKEARATHSTFRANHPILDLYTNSPTLARPTPAISKARVYNLRNALHNIKLAPLQRGMTAEMTKVFETYKCLKLLTTEQESNSEYIRLLFAIKPKPLATDPANIRVRLAADGARQPPHTYGLTHAGTSDATQRAFIMAITLADCATRKCFDRLQVVGFDFPSAFINGNSLPRSATGGIQLVTRIPDSPLISDEYRNKLAEITGPLNGLKQSNHIYDQNLIATLEGSGFMRLPSASYVFHKRCPNNSQDYLTLPMNVDDGTIFTTSPVLLAELKTLLLNRYGPMDFVDESPGMCGVRNTYYPDGASLDFGPYLRRALISMGMHTVPPALTPSTSDFFKPSLDSTPATPQQQDEFRTTNGILIFTLPLRPDYRMEVVHLCKANDNPTKSDIEKQFHLLRYICGTPDLGPFFSADPADHPNGVEISGSTDISFNALHGSCLNAHALQVGPPNTRTSPFVTHSALGAEKPLSPAEGEYISASDTAKKLLYWRQVAEELGFPQTRPSIILEDNASAIKLANSPQIPTKSRHIELKFHHIRDLIRRRIITLQHCITQKMVTDSMTKVSPPPLFLYNRSIIFPRAITQLTNQPPLFKPI